MLIELRSSEADPSNTPNQLHQRFNETLILKPNTRVALVCALTTTDASGGYTVNGANDQLSLTIGWFTPANGHLADGTVMHGSYTGTDLAQVMQNTLRYLIAQLANEMDTLFYPNQDVHVDYVAATGFSVTIRYDPQGFTNTMPPSVDVPDFTNQVHCTLNQLDNIRVGGLPDPSPYLGMFMRSRDTLYDGVTDAMAYNDIYSTLLTRSEVTTSNCLATHTILPYADVNVADFSGAFQLANCPLSQRNLRFGLKTSAGQAAGRFLMPSGGKYTRTGVSIVYFDQYTGQYGYHYKMATSVGGAPFTFAYVVQTDTDTIDEYSVSATDVVWNGATVWADTLTLIPNADALGTGYMNTAAQQFDSANVIQRAGDADYEIVINGDSQVDLLYRGVILNVANPLVATETSQFRWVMNAINDATAQHQYPVPQVSADGGTTWNEIAHDADRNIPNFLEDTYIYPEVNQDGLLHAGALGGGAIGEDETTTSFRAVDMSLGNKVGNFIAGEILVTAGATTPAGGLDLHLVAVCGTGWVGYSGVISAVKCVGGMFAGQNLANAMVIPMRGSFSGSTVDVTINAVAGLNYTIANAGLGYAVGEECQLVWSGGPAFSFPYADVPALTRVAGLPPSLGGVGNNGCTVSGLIRITAVGGGGVITGFDVILEGAGYEVNDTVSIVSLAGGSNGVLLINQTAEDPSQFSITKMDTRVTDYPPMRPQNHIDLNTNVLGQNLLMVPINFAGSAGHGTHQPIMQSSANPPLDNPANENILIDVTEFPIGSRNSGIGGLGDGGNTDNHIATIPYQTDLNNQTGASKQHYEPYNITYHDLKNETDLNLNELHVRLTNYDGTLRTDLTHPTQLTLHVQPEYK